MNLFRTTAAVLALTTGLLSVAVQAEDSLSMNNDVAYDVQAPKGFAMLGDLVFARPLLICATAIGAVAFVVALPFSALGGNVEASGQALVLEPGREAFVRCLGCESAYQKM